MRFKLGSGSEVCCVLMPNMMTDSVPATVMARGFNGREPQDDFRNSGGVELVAGYP